MIDGLKPYGEYKDSAHEWLGLVPSHWRVQSLGSLSSAISLRGRPDLPLLSVVREKGVIPRASMGDNENHNYIPDDLSNYKVVRRGNLVINKMKAWQGSMGVASQDGIVSPAYYVFDLQVEDLRYAHALLRSKSYVAFWHQSSDGVRIGQWDLSLIGMKRIPIVVPPPEEQAAIVRFLDHADRRIRRYIRAKRQLIGLLNEQKQAIIHRAVTRGLDPHVKLKPSGVEWLGDVPEHWGVYQARALSQVVRGGTPRPAGSPEFFHGSAEPWITVGELTKDSGMFLEATSTRLTPKGVERSRTIYPGTLLLTNSGATLGVPKITHIQGCINDGVAAFLRMRPGVVSEYLYYYWSSQTKHLHAWVNLGAQPNLNTQIIGGWPVLLPPSDEQRRIADFLTSELNQIAISLQKLGDEISLIQEYRTRLIADVVTGKLDVREAAAALPDELEAVEPDVEELLDEDDTTDDVELDTEPEDVEA